MRNSRKLLAATLVLLAGACGGGGGAAAKLAKACVDQGVLNATTCECFSKEMVKEASPAAIDAMLIQAEQGMVAGMQAIQKLKPKDQGSIAAGQAAGAAACRPNLQSR